jgi:hypothetical protein
MAWLRIDDLAVLNPKLGELTDGDFRALLALWSYCARRRNDGRFKADEIRHASYASPKGAANVDQGHLQRFVQTGLITHRGGKADLYEIKDWAVYQPKDATAAERQRAYRARNANRNGDRNENVTSRARIPSRPSKDGTVVRDAGDERPLTGSSPGAKGQTKQPDPRRVQAAIAEAEQVATHWEHGGSDIFDDKLETIARAHRTIIPSADRDRLWDIAFAKGPA